MKYALVLSALSALLCIPAAHATDSSGCFVDHSNPSVCSTQVINCDILGPNNQVWFGTSVARLCQELNSLSKASTETEKFVSSLESTQEEMAEELKSAQRRSRAKTKLIKRLIRTCGSQCDGVL